MITMLSDFKTMMMTKWIGSVLLLWLIGDSNAQVVVNEVSETGTLNTCGTPSTGLNAVDWVEIQNRGTVTVDISGYTMYDDAGPTSLTKCTFPSGTVLNPNELRLLCRTATFTYGIGGTDMITLANVAGTVISTTGILLGLGSVTTTIQLRNDGVTYAYAPQKPNATNVFPPPDVVVNEVASTGNAIVCTSGDYIELFNRNPSQSDISDWILRDDSNATYVVPNNTTIAPSGYIVFCQSQFIFDIGGSDTITLYNPSNNVVSTSGKLLGTGTSTLTYSRRPNNGTFSYTKPSPNAVNTFFSPLVGSIYVNEVASTPVSGVCAGQDYIELLNSNTTTAINLTGFVLHDENGPSNVDAYRFPDTTPLLAPNAVRLLCGQSSFAFGINGEDTITILDANSELISTTGKMLNLATATSTYQLSSDRTGYLYATPSPGTSNNAVIAPKVVINEVADKEVPMGCNGTDYIELYNEGSGPADISNYRLRDDNINNPSFVIPMNTIIPSLGFVLFCGSQFGFGISGTDTITLFDGFNVSVATTGQLLNLGSTMLTYSRRPNGIYAYTKPTPNTTNIFFSLLSDLIFVNEVANTPVAGVCANQDWVELINTGVTAVNVSGFLLHDDAGPNGTEPFLFPANSTLFLPGEIRLLCGDSPGNFQFGIGGTDAITLLDTNRDVISATGRLLNLGTATSTYQRTPNNTYVYSSPTPGFANFVAIGGRAVINEIAPAGTIVANACGGGPYIEILNDAFVALNLSGFVLSVGTTGNYTFPSGSAIASNALSVFCQNQTYLFNISSTDTIAITNETGTVVSSSGPIGGANPLPNSIGLTWARVVDVINPSTPFAPFYQYSINPTPGARNIFSFDPIPLPRQPCGIQTAPLAMLNDYEFKQLVAVDIGSRNPEFSGGTFDPRTCNNLVVGDEGNLNELSILNSTVNLLRTIPVIGGSSDTEGICFWYNEATSESKVAIVDERDRSVAICDLPTISQVVPLFRDSSNCRIVSLAQNQRNRTSSDPNEGFEGIACDPLNGKLYVIQEKNPMLMWSVDFTTGTYKEMIDVQNLPSWTSRVADLAGIAYDSFSQSLYVLSQESKVIVQSSLNGTIIGTTISVNMMTAPEGLSFEPTTGDLIVVGEPNQIARFSKKLVTVTKSPTKAPAKVPTNSPSKPPTFLPSLSPTSRPIKIPVKVPIAIPIPIPAPLPVATPAAIPTPSTSKSPNRPPTSLPSQSPTSRPIKAPAKVPLSVPIPIPVPLPVFTPAVVPTPGSTPVVAPLAVPVTTPAIAPFPVPKAVPAAVPVSSPVTVPVKTPVIVPVSVTIPTKPPSKSPTGVPVSNRRCGLFGLSLFCPFTFCGLFGRLIGVCNGL